jgi:hypothetical protein
MHTSTVFHQGNLERLIHIELYDLCKTSGRLSSSVIEVFTRKSHPFRRAHAAWALLFSLLLSLRMVKTFYFERRGGPWENLQKKGMVALGLFFL